MTATVMLCVFGAVISFALGALSTYVVVAILWPLERIADERSDAAESRHG